MSSTYYTVYLKPTAELVVHGNSVEYKQKMKNPSTAFTV